MNTLNPLKKMDTSESVNLHKYLVLLDSCRIHATRWLGSEILLDIVVGRVTMVASADRHRHRS